MWGQVEKIGKGTKANYDPDKKIITFCFNRSPQTSSELLRTLRERLMKELRELGYESRMKYNGEVVVDNIAEEDVALAKKDHKLIIHLNKKQVGEKEKDTSELNLSSFGKKRLKFNPKPTNLCYTRGRSDSNGSVVSP
jgi:hypothetical protein